MRKGLVLCLALWLSLSPSASGSGSAPFFRLGRMGYDPS